MSGQSGRPDQLAVYAAALRRVAELAAFAVVPAMLFVYAVHTLIGDGFAVDFHAQYWPAGNRVLSGLSPYDLGWMDIQHEVAFPYGAVPALLFVPFALLPLEFGDAIFAGLCVAAVPASLWLCGVRDWRVYGIAFLWQPVLSAWTTANVTLLMTLGIALLWRSRERAPVAGLIVALLVSVKWFVWPLAIWLLGSRRYGALCYAAACGLMLNVVAWSVIGFDQIGAYVKVLGLVTDREEPRSYSLLALGLDHGMSRSAGYVLTFVLAAGLGSACVLLARRGREEPALLICIAMALVATPVTWAHYFALLIVPLALLRPRLSPVWGLPVVMSVCPSGGPETWQLVLALVMIAALVVAALRPLDTHSADAEAPRSAVTC